MKSSFHISRCARIFFITFCLFATTRPLHAQWTQGSSSPSNVQAITVLHEKIFVGCNQNTGIYLSKNEGDSWSSINNGLGNKNVWCIAISDTTLFAGTSAGIYRSTDFGAHWTLSSNGFPNVSVSSIAINGDIIFAGSLASGVYRSTDNGDNWSSVNSGLSDTSVSKLLVCFETE